MPEPSLTERLSALRTKEGIGFPAIRRLLGDLAQGGGGDLGTLVESTMVPRRRIQEIARELGLAIEEGAITLDGDQQAALAAAALPPAGLPPAQLSAVSALMEEAVVRRPPAKWQLDHVPATVATVIRRATRLAEVYDLAGAHVVCVGDHDLTSLAIKALAPDASVSLVDIDEDLLVFLDAEAEARGLPIAGYSADLRLGLPPTLAGTADLVFTDPPYSPEGVELFVRRGIEALRPHPEARIEFCYGTSDRGDGSQLDVQRMLARSHIVLEALLPGFNRYQGAHAIGASSGLWVCRPTGRSVATMAARGAGDGNDRIYSRGPGAAETPAGRVPARIREALEAWATGGPGPVRLVGEGWGPDAVPLAAWLAQSREPPARKGPPRGPETILVHLPAPASGGMLVQVLAAVPARSAVGVVTDPAAAVAVDEPGIRRLLAARHTVYRLATPGGPRQAVVGEPSPVDPDADPAGFVLHYLLEHPGARLRNAWREALCFRASRMEVALTKNEARVLVEAAGLRASDLDAYLLDLPLHRLEAVVGAVVGAVGATPPPAPPARSRPEVAASP